MMDRKDLFETKAKGRSDGKAKEKILVLIPETTFVGVESRVLIPETTFVGVESRVLIPETTFVGVESRVLIPETTVWDTLVILRAFAISPLGLRGSIRGYMLVLVKALVEINADTKLKKEIMVVPMYDGDGYTREHAKEIGRSAPNLATTNTTFEVNHDEGFIEVKGRKNKEKKTDAQPKSRPIGGASSSNPNENKEASPSRAKSGVISTPMSILFDVLNNLAEDDDEVQAKSNLNEPNNSNQQPPGKEDNVASTSNHVSSIGDFEFGEVGKSDDDEVFEPNDVMARYISSTGGGQ
ncbi:hypothetical protein Tco_0950514 [Tanacetum coccineum]